MDDVAPLIARVRAAHPALPLDPARARLDDGGQNNLVLTVDERYIFRFPRLPEALDRMRAEVSLLRAIASRLPLRVPDPLFCQLNADADAAFMGYPMIPGLPLRRETYARLPDTTPPRIARQLGDFLRALHQMDVDTLPDRPPIAAERRTWEELYRRVRDLLYPLMRPAARAEVAAHFEAALGDPGFWAFEPALIHGDLGGDNILFDEVAQRINGIIDFGSAGIGDPAIDIAALTSRHSLPEAFVVLMESAYTGVTGLLDRARFYRGTFALQYALFGAQTGDAAALSQGLARYR